MDKSDLIYVAGHKGMVGSAVVRVLRKLGFKNVIVRSSKELDLRDSATVQEFFKDNKPDVVILAAARVGGIQANVDHPAEFLYENLVMQNNVIHQSYVSGVKAFCFLGSSCVYPTQCRQPMREEDLLTGPLEPTNEGYALAKIAGLKMVEFYHRQYGFNGLSIMPCNLYGTDDNFDPLRSHVLAALVRKTVDAVDDGQKRITLWGTGNARREFMHVDNAAEAIIFLMTKTGVPRFRFINIGWGEDITVRDLSQLVAEKAGFKGEFVWDASKPDGMLRKCLDVSKMKALGYYPKITLPQGIEQTIEEYRILKKRQRVV